MFVTLALSSSHTLLRTYRCLIVHGWSRGHTSSKESAWAAPATRQAMMNAISPPESIVRTGSSPMRPVCQRYVLSGPPSAHTGLPGVAATKRPSQGRVPQTIRRARVAPGKSAGIRAKFCNAAAEPSLLGADYRSALGGPGSPRIYFDGRSGGLRAPLRMSVAGCDVEASMASRTKSSSWRSGTGLLSTE